MDCQTASGRSRTRLGLRWPTVSSVLSGEDPDDHLSWSGAWLGQFVSLLILGCCGAERMLIPRGSKRSLPTLELLLISIILAFLLVRPYGRAMSWHRQ